MRIAAVSHVEMTVDPVRSSAEILWKTTRLQALLLVTASIAGMAGLIYPIFLIGADAATSPQVMETMGLHIGSTILLTAGVLLGLLVLYFPLRAGLARLGGAGKAKLIDGHVQVERQGIMSREQWTVPLTEYCGVTHHIRATLSGPRHEIILVHPEPNRDVLLNLAARHPQEGATYYAELLGLQEVQPRTLYQRRRPVPAPVSENRITARAA
jgi:hypothetical protein